jgi:hypothetical protein
LENGRWKLENGKWEEKSEERINTEDAEEEHGVHREEEPDSTG